MYEATKLDIQQVYHSTRTGRKHTGKEQDCLACKDKPYVNKVPLGRPANPTNFKGQPPRGGWGARL